MVKIKNAMTLVEILIVLVVMTFLFLLCTNPIKKIAPDKDAIMIKKSYINLKNTVKEMASDELAYPDITVFKNGEYFEDGDIKCKGSTKFKCLFKSKLNIKQDNVPCDVLALKDGVFKREASTCFIVSDGTAYGIPDDNFYFNDGTTKDETYVTTYPTRKKMSEQSAFQKYAAFFVIRYDGKIRFLDPDKDNVVGIDCKNKNSKDIYCITKEILTSQSVLKGDR